jgi:hypothetical protein
VLGEVPGFFFLLAGLWLWFAAWERASWLRLGLVGLLFGMAIVTKYQYLLFFVPALGLVWLANLVYYRATPQRVFLIPGMVAAVCFALWQICLLVYLGPATVVENLATIRESAAGVAFAFSLQRAELNFRELIGSQVYLGSLLPALVFGLSLAVPRDRKGQQWGIILGLVIVNLAWYVLASVGWKRYYFLGVGLSSLYVARLLYELSGGFRLSLRKIWQTGRQDQTKMHTYGVSLAALVWLAIMIVLPLAKNVQLVISPPFNAPLAMAHYLDENLAREELIETWEPEMGFLTDHNYHYPPTRFLTHANNHIWSGGPATAQFYDFVQTERPEYILIGATGRQAEIYSADVLAENYRIVYTVGEYELYEINTQP